MEKQAAKDASGSKEVIKKEAEPWRCERNKHLYERNKREVVLTESELEEIGSDLEEFLWTYDDDKPYEEYQAEAQQALRDLLSYVSAKRKKGKPEAADVDSK
ncbi:hypothetical protein QL285_075350 [Trifolium repens]|jgi:DNA polymerase IIIc chi subunit|nr:hypothetical protein QL285_075350 [Trifolium repens]